MINPQLKAERRKVFHELLMYITKNKINHFAVEKTDSTVATRVQEAAKLGIITRKGNRSHDTCKVLPKALCKYATYSKNINTDESKHYSHL